MKITCLHTAQVHVATFDALFVTHEGVVVEHVVRADLLADAQVKPLEDLRGAVDAEFARHDAADAVLCTCSTLGPLVGDDPRFLRVDRPAMQAAVGHGPDVMVVICLESTKAATLALLADVAKDEGAKVAPRLVAATEAWPFFEAGDLSAFSQTIAKAVRQEITDGGTPSCILLAQASMRVAASALSDIGCPVLTTPELAVLAAVDAVVG